MNQAKTMLDQKKAELALKKYTASNQGVKVECTGAMQITKVTIPQLMADERDPELLEDLIIIAANKALALAKEDEEEILRQGAMDFLPNLGV